MNPRPKILAHRGGRRNAPENTIVAFRLALENGADGIECDVRMTRDGELVLLHDNDLRRVTGNKGLVNRLTWSQLRTIRVQDREPVAHLYDLLDLLTSCPSATCWFDLRVHETEAVERIVRTIEGSGLADRSYILTFSHLRRLLHSARTVSPKIGISVMPLIPVGILGTAQRAGADSICIGWNQWAISKVWFRFFTILRSFRGEVERAHRAGIDVSGGVANTPTEVRWLFEHGISAVWTDDVPMTQQALRDVA